MDFVPDWIRQASPSTGRDPLGMQAPSLALYQSLVPGITNVTLRARYYSFYPWLCHKIASQAHHYGADSAIGWRRAVRRAECLLALSVAAAELADADGLGGIDFARPVYAKSYGQGVDFQGYAEPPARDDRDGRYLLAASGVFGQAYRPALIGLGVLDEQLPIPGLLGKGPALADAFAGSVGPAGTLFLECVRAGRATDAQLRTIGAAFRPGAVSRSGPELVTLRDLLFDEKGPGATDRVASLNLIRAVADGLGGTPRPEDVRVALLFGRVQRRAIPLPPDLEPWRQRWAAYQINEYGQIAMGALLALLLSEVQAGDVPVEHASRQVATIALKHAPAPGGAAATWTAFREPYLDAYAVEPAGALEEKFARVIEAGTGTRGAVAARQSGAGAALALLAVLEGWVSEAAVADALPKGAKALASRSVDKIFARLRARAEEPLDELISTLVRDEVVHRHVDVAYEKFVADRKKETFLFDTWRGRIVHPRDTIIGYTTPRLRTSIRFLQDLGMLKLETCG